MIYSMATASRSNGADKLREIVAEYVEERGMVFRMGRNGKRHQIRSRAAYLRGLLIERHGADVAMTQQAIGNFLMGRSKNIRLDHAELLAKAVGAVLLVTKPNVDLK